MKKTFLILVLSIWQSQAFSQCSMCKAVVESEIKNGSMNANGINNGIIYLMIIPYLLMLGVGYILYKNYKKNKSAQETL